MENFSLRKSAYKSFSASVLRGELPKWPEAWKRNYEHEYLRHAHYHGIEALLYDRLCGSLKSIEWPHHVCHVLKTNTQHYAALELIYRNELRRVIKAWTEGKCSALLFKGTPLAYKLYATPHLRPRVDTDVIIPGSQLESVKKIMKDLGYEQNLAVPGDAILSQTALSRTEENGISHTFDIHWDISNPAAFSNKLTFNEMLSECEPVEELEVMAFTPSAVHALLIACIHRAAHHMASNRLIWLYDIHLLLKSMDSDEQTRFSALVKDKQLSQVCCDAVETSVRYFKTPMADDLVADLRSIRASSRGDATSVYITGTKNRLALFWRDLRSQSGLRAMLDMLKQNVLPPAPYMLARYGTKHRLLLPYLYIKRFFGGVPKLFSR